MEYDLIIRDGSVVDGTGALRFRADVGVTGDRITTIGAIEATGTKEIDVTGSW